MSRRRHDYNGVRECSAVINCIVALVLAILGTVSILKYKGGHCEQVLHVPIVWVALAFAVISTILSCYADVGCLMCANGCCSCLFTIFLLCFCIFALSVTHKGGGDNLPGKAYKEYRLEDYSKWLQHKVNNTKMWTKIRKCLVRRHACKKLTHDWANITLQQFYTKRLSSIESGCCKPSNDCNFSYVSPTNWTTTANSTYTKPDCRVWNNDPNILCLDCQSCKAGVADKYKHNWFDGVQALT